MEKVCKNTEREEKAGNKPPKTFQEFMAYVYRKPFERADDLEKMLKYKLEVLESDTKKSLKKETHLLQMKIDDLEKKNIQLQEDITAHVK